MKVLSDFVSQRQILADKTESVSFNGGLYYLYRFL